MPTDDKAAAVAELTDLFQRSSAAVLTEYRGLSVAEISRLRKALGTHATYAVTKNTLARIAARNAGIDTLDDGLTGPTAIAFVTGDVVEAAKGLRAYARETPTLVIKGGVLEGRPIDVAEVGRLADLEPREVVLARLAGAMKAPLSKAVFMASAPLSQAARLLDALRAKLAEGAPADAAPDAAPEAAASADPASEATGDTSADTSADTRADSTEPAAAGA